MIRGFGVKKKQKRVSKRKNVPFKRVEAKLQLDSSKQVVESRVFLNDLSPKGLGCFVNEPIAIKEQVNVVIDYPRNIFIRGEVIWCKPYSLDTKVIREMEYKFRVGIKFIFDDKEEEAAVKSFHEEVQKLT